MLVNDTPSFALLFNQVTFLIPVVFVLPWFCFQTVPFLPTSPIWILLTFLVPTQLESFSQSSSAHEEVSSSQSLSDLHSICLIWANPWPVFPAIRVFLTSSYSAHWSPWMFWTAAEGEVLSGLGYWRRKFQGFCWWCLTEDLPVAEKVGARNDKSSSDNIQDPDSKNWLFSHVCSCPFNCSSNSLNWPYFFNKPLSMLSSLSLDVYLATQFACFS